ncbi:MAG: hypothetical protein AAGA93_00415 [Actinomycetota bacterium]
MTAAAVAAPLALEAVSFEQQRNPAAQIGGNTVPDTTPESSTSIELPGIVENERDGRGSIGPAADDTAVEEPDDAPSAPTTTEAPATTSSTSASTTEAPTTTTTEAPTTTTTAEPTTSTAEEPTTTTTQSSSTSSTSSSSTTETTVGSSTTVEPSTTTVATTPPAT